MVDSPAGASLRSNIDSSGPFFPANLLGCIFLAFIVLCASATRSASAQESFADVVERTEKSVIRIEVTGPDGEGLGSGFVVDDQGTIVTNCHVLAGAQSATAIFADGKRCEIEGTFVIDEARDIVVAKIPIETAPAIEIADKLPRKGEEAFALGAPRGLAFTVTKGIVSAIRSADEMNEDVGQGDEVKGTWIQVDVALSPGNSGGPLINTEGKVVGMSTLASLGGMAQNLNFGISAEDIRKALTYAGSSRLTSLARGVARIEMNEPVPSGIGPDSALAAKTIPKAAFQGYITEGSSQFTELLRGLRMESAQLSVELKEMKKGSPYLPPRAKNEGVSVVRVESPDGRERRWFFRSQTIKDKAIQHQQDRIRHYMRLKNEIGTKKNVDSMHSLLMNFGPLLDVKQNQTIGFAEDLLVLHAFNGHDVLVMQDDNVFLYWMETTAGVASGDILRGPVFVAGTTTAVLQSGVTTAVTVLQEVPEDALLKAVQAELNASVANKSPADGFRIWKDKSGKYTVEAKLVTSDAASVVLRRRDGSIVQVPLNALSEADRQHLAK